MCWTWAKNFENMGLRIGFLLLVMVGLLGLLVTVGVWLVVVAVVVRVGVVTLLAAVCSSWIVVCEGGSVWCWRVVVFFLGYKDQQGNDNGGKTAGQERKCMHALNWTTATIWQLYCYDETRPELLYCFSCFFLAGRSRYHEIIFHNELLFCGDQI